MVTVTFRPNAARRGVLLNELKALMGGMRWCFADYAAGCGIPSDAAAGFPWTYARSMSLLAKAPAAVERLRSVGRAGGLSRVV